MILPLYLLRQIVVSVLVAAGGIALIVLPAILVSALHELGAANSAALFGFLPLISARLVPFLAPIAFLLAVVAAFGRLAQDNEWTAIRMAGFHPARVLLPSLLVAAALGAGTWHLLHEISPEWTFRQATYKREALVEAIKGLDPGRTEIRIGKFYLHAARRDQATNTFHDVVVQLPDTSESQDQKPTRAKDVLLVVERMQLWFQGDELVARLRGVRLVKGEFDWKGEEFYYRKSLDELVRRPSQERIRPKFHASSRLRAELAAGSGDAAWQREARYEIHRREALASTYFLFLALGAPTGLFLRRGSQLAALAVAVGYALCFYVLFLRLGKELAYRGAVPPWLAAWATHLLGGIAGAALVRKVFRA